MKEFWVYTGLRLSLFAASLGVVFGIWALVADSVPLLWVIVIAFLVSGVASYFLLNAQRDAFARRVESRVEHMKSKEDID
ncbi:DUF4229 domain-containing protein [Nocardioides ferulae]|uniref:DUF4229 domain-containing protein n=1 Tax=Nocardioides ferulae TaxID=2340821 RepID=UPI000EAD7F2D|nr:DUF4229 domain-containing protein [Nocardioides ferulae]